MPLSDVLVAALSRPAGRVVDSPVRAIVDEILKERGYASPAEVAALRDETGRLKKQAEGLAGRLEQLGAQLGAIREAAEALRADALAAAARADAAEARAEAAEARLVALEQARVSAPAVPAPAEPAAAPAEEPSAAAEPATGPGCRVPDCAGAHHAQGFCRAHLHAWRAGRLPGFVSPEGLLEIDGRAHRVAADLAGLPYKVSEKDGRLRVAGRLRAVTPLQEL